MAIDIFTYWDSSEHPPEHQARMLKVWVASWEARGWNPRFLTVRNAKQNLLFKHLPLNAEPLYWQLALEAVGGGFYAGHDVINFGFFAPKKKLPRGCGNVLYPQFRYLSLGWEGAPLVSFENCHPDVVLNCGRKL